MTDVRVLRVSQGFNGWSPRLAVVADGARYVLKLAGWTGGQGNPPPSDLYLGAIGYVTDIEDAIDISGAAIRVNSATFAAIPTLTISCFVFVAADETNDNLPTVYFFDGSDLQWIPSVGV